MREGSTRTLEPAFVQSAEFDLMHDNPSPSPVLILAAGLFPRDVWLPCGNGKYTFHTGWKFMVAAGNSCIPVDQPQGNLCEILDGPHKGVRFHRDLGVFKPPEP